MALSQQTLDAIAAAVAAAFAAQAAVSAPATGSAAQPSRSKDGRDFPCAADKPCSRSLRSANRAAVHGVVAGGHEAR
jgi:hypothetical protein